MEQQPYKVTFSTGLCCLALMIIAMFALPGLQGQTSASPFHANNTLSNKKNGDKKQIQVDMTPKIYISSPPKSVIVYNGASHDGTFLGCFNLDGEYTNLTNNRGEKVFYSSNYAEVTFYSLTGECPLKNSKTNLTKIQGDQLTPVTFSQPTYVDSTIARFTLP